MTENCNHNCAGCKSDCSERNEPPSRLLSIKHKLLVMSGKGGVGKSTMAASLAVSLAQQGFKTALLDVDFHGPSQPTLFHLRGRRLSGDENGLNPMEVSGIRLVSLGLLMDDEDTAVIWRGPAKIGVLKQLFEEVNWGATLDYLVLDFPPGTGDEALSACQMIPGDKKAIVVTTPQEISLADCRKCMDFCIKLDVPVLGIIENMSGFICPSCSAHYDIFSSGGGQKLSDAYGVPLLAKVPLDPVFLKQCDEGALTAGLAKSTAVSSEIGKAVTVILEDSARGNAAVKNA